MSDIKHHHAECVKLFSRLSEYIDNELDEVTCQDIEQHLANCKPCKVCLETLKRTVALCRNMKDQPVPEAFSTRLKAILQSLS
jgi:anti-sigma factor RsiW